MIPALLITLREVIEASLIVATILGILSKLNKPNEIRTVWAATIAALIASFLLVFGGATIGVNIQKFYTDTTEGMLYIISAFFVTWAVFFLHNQFGRKKMHLLQTMKESIAGRSIFFLTFTAVFREGIEIALFLSTIYLTNTPFAIMTGFAAGLLFGIGISYLFFSATIRMPVYYAFRVTSALLIVTAGGLLARGIEEFPIHVVATLPAIVCLTYIFIMHRWVFVRSR